MYKSRLYLLGIFLVSIFVLSGCGRNAKIKGTYIHKQDDSFGEFIIVHDGGKVSVEINGKKYDAKMSDQNVITVENDHLIHETYADENENPDINNCKKDLIIITDAKEWIDGDYEVNDNGYLLLTLDRQ